MADMALRDYLSGPQMTKLFDSEAVRAKVPNQLPEAFLAEGPARPAGLDVTWEEVIGNRQTAHYVHGLSPSRRAEVPGVSKKTATAIGAKEHLVIDSDMMMALKSDIPFIAEGARRKLVRDMRQFGIRFDDLRIGAVASALSQGGIYFGADGQLLPNSTGAKIGVPFTGVVTKAKTDYITGTTGPKIGDWSNAGTDIPAALRAIRRAFRLTTGYEPKFAMYGQNIPSYFANNTAMQAFMSRNQFLGKEFADTNEVPKGLLDYSWKPTYSMYNLKDDGTQTAWWADNQIVITPDVGNEWYEFIPAGVLVPNGLASPNMDLDRLISLCTIKNGRFSYTELATDPIFAKVIVGDYFLPVIKVPSVVWSITVS